MNLLTGFPERQPSTTGSGASTGAVSHCSRFRRLADRIRTLGLALGLLASAGAVADIPIPGGVADVPSTVVFPPSDSYAISRSTDPGYPALLFRIKPNGVRSIVSDLGDPGQGPLDLASSAIGWDSIAVESSGKVLVTGRRQEGASSVLYRIDPATGQRTPLSDLADPVQGPTGVVPMNGLALEAGGGILALCWVVDSYPAGTVLLRVDPETGQRTILSEFEGTGYLGLSLALEHTGAILVAARGIEAGKVVGALWRVDPRNGHRAVLSDFVDSAQGPLPLYTADIAVESNGRVLLLALSSDDDYNDEMQILRVNPSTGMRTLVSNFQDASQGPVGYFPYSLAVQAGGNILALSPYLSGPYPGSPYGGALLRVNAGTGHRTVVSKFGDAAKGPPGTAATGLALVHSCLDWPATKLGTAGNDVLTGTPGNDVILGLGGDDIISGGPGGQDVLCGGEGNDQVVAQTALRGRSAGPLVRPFAGPTVLDGGAGNDTLTGSPADDLIGGGPGDDLLEGGGGVNFLDGGSGTDTCMNGAYFSNCELF